MNQWNAWQCQKSPDGSEWVYEIKLDGYRALGIKSDGGVRLRSRRNNSFNRHYPLVVEALGDLPEDTVVDGEVVALDESGFPNFSLLQNYRSEASRIHSEVNRLIATPIFRYEVEEKLVQPAWID